MHTHQEIKTSLQECAKGENRECKKHCHYYTKDASCTQNLRNDTIKLITVLENDNKVLQDRIANQRHMLYKLQLMYDWAVERLRNNHLNDRAHFQAWLHRHGFEDGAIEEMRKEMANYEPINFSK